MPRTNIYDQPVGDPVPDTSPRLRPSRSPMQGAQVHLTPTRADDAPALFAAFAAAPDTRDWTYLPYGPFETEAAFTAWLGSVCLDDDPLFHTVHDADGPAGLASYLRIDPSAASIEVGHIHFSRRLQGTAAAREAMHLMMTRVFDELGYRRYEWKCDALNARSCRAAERLGFTYEGTFRQATHYKGRNRDTAWYAITDADWPAVKARWTT